jgi:hypothetical protein
MTRYKLRKGKEGKAKVDFEIIIILKNTKKVKVIFFLLYRILNQGLQKFKLKETHFLRVANPGLPKLKLRETHFHEVSNLQLHGKRHPQSFEFVTSISHRGDGAGRG